MRVAASLVLRNERARYLEPCIEHLLEFCDIIVALNDASDDGTAEWLWSHPSNRVIVESQARSTFYEHEGKTRQLLIDVTLEQRPDFVFSCDADEFVADGAALRARLEAEPDIPVWSLEIAEVWNARPDALDIRCDGGWRPHQLACLWKAPLPGETFAMLDKKLACRRVPTQVLAQKAKPINQSLLHFGWANQRERQQRYDRYAKHDGGRFHAGSHLRSILWEDRRVKLQARPWPEGPVFDKLKQRFSVLRLAEKSSVVPADATDEERDRFLEALEAE